MINSVTNSTESASFPLGEGKNPENINNNNFPNIIANTTSTTSTTQSRLRRSQIKIRQMTPYVSKKQSRSWEGLPGTVSFVKSASESSKRQSVLDTSEKAPRLSSATRTKTLPNLHSSQPLEEEDEIEEVREQAPRLSKRKSFHSKVSNTEKAQLLKQYAYQTVEQKIKEIRSLENKSNKPIIKRELIAILNKIVSQEYFWTSQLASYQDYKRFRSDFAKANVGLPQCHQVVLANNIEKLDMLAKQLDIIPSKEYLQPLRDALSNLLNQKDNLNQFNQVLHDISDKDKETKKLIDQIIELKSLDHWLEWIKKKSKEVLNLECCRRIIPLKCFHKWKENEDAQRPIDQIKISDVIRSLWVNGKAHECLSLSVECVSNTFNSNSKILISKDHDNVEASIQSLLEALQKCGWPFPPEEGSLKEQVIALARGQGENLKIAKLFRTLSINVLKNARLKTNGTHYNPKLYEKNPYWSQMKPKPDCGPDEGLRYQIKISSPDDFEVVITWPEMVYFFAESNPSLTDEEKSCIPKDSTNCLVLAAAQKEYTLTWNGSEKHPRWNGVERTLQLDFLPTTPYHIKKELIEIFLPNCKAKDLWH